MNTSNITKAEALKYSEMLEAHPQYILKKLASAKDSSEALVLLDEIKKNAHKRLRILAKDLHPDKTDNVEKHSLFKKLVLIVEELDQTTLSDFIRPIHRPQQYIIVQTHMSNWGSTTTNSTTTNNTAYYYYVRK